MKESSKRRFIMLGFAVLFAVAALLGGCDNTGVGNKTLMDVTYTYDKAIIQLANGEVVDVKVKSWNDYDGEQLQIVAEDGTVYLTNSFRCDLIKTKKED